MKELFSIFFFTSLWLTFAGYINNVFNKFFISDQKFQKIIFLSLSLGFIFSFLVLAELNLLSHLFGISLLTLKIVIPLSFIIIFFNFKNIKHFSLKIFSLINQLRNSIRNSLRNSLKKRDILIISLLLVFTIQTICLIIRAFLPLTHLDAMGQYFYDSLQISRLEDINLLEFYEMGMYFRSDSLASFFDATFIELTNNWFLLRLTRLISLFLVIFSSIELLFNLGSFNFKKSLLFICLILTLPDVWSVFISGKHDGYTFLFEFIGIYIIFLSIQTKDKFFKICLSLFSVFLGFICASIRLSSLSFLLISFLLLIYFLFRYRDYLFSFNLIKLLSGVPIIQISFLLITLLIPYVIFLLNYKYFSNPFYWLSPPGFLSTFFKNSFHEINYVEIKETLSLRNIPSIFKPIATFLYTALGLEPLRFLLTKFDYQNNLFSKLLGTLNYFGPKGMMVSIIAFSPFSLLTFLQINSLKNYKKFILSLLTLWLILWSLSIPYSRTAIVSSLSLIVIAFSMPISFSDYSFKSFAGFLRISIFSYGILCIFLFTIWSLSTLYDLPIKSLISSKEYSRASLSRDYIKLQNNTLGLKNIIPSINFENSWKQIEENNPNKNLFLKAPKQFSYFMNKGLIIKDISNLNIKRTEKSLCYVIDSDQELIKKVC